MVLIFGVKIDLEVDDGAAVQGPAHVPGCDPGVKADRHIIGAAGGTQRFVVHGLLVDDVDLSGWFDR